MYAHPDPSVCAAGFHWGFFCGVAVCVFLVFAAFHKIRRK